MFVKLHCKFAQQLHYVVVAFVLVLCMLLCVYMDMFVCVGGVCMDAPTKTLRHSSENQQTTGKYMKMVAGIPEEHESTKLSGGK